MDAIEKKVNHCNYSIKDGLYKEKYILENANNYECVTKKYYLTVFSFDNHKKNSMVE